MNVLLNVIKMKIISRTPKRVVLEVSFEDMEEFGFDYVWDEIRDKFPASEYYNYTFNQNEEEETMYFELYRTLSFDDESVIEATKRKEEVSNKIIGEKIYEIISKKG